MQLRLVNQELTAFHLFEEFESLIWTEQWQGAGNFELRIKQHNYLLGSLKFYDFLTFSESGSLMQVETIEMPKQSEGDNLLVIKGRSVESFLQLRTNTTYGENPDISIGPKVGDAIEWMADRYLINPDNPENKIPGLIIGYIDGATPLVAGPTPRNNLYAVIDGLAKSGDVGWGIQYYAPEKVLRLNVTTGLDYSNRYANYYKEFSQDNGSLTGTSYLSSIANYKNHVRVEGARQVVDVYAGVPDTIPPHAGWNRRTIVVKATGVGTDEETDPATDIPILRKLGDDALKEVNHQYISTVDGNVPLIHWDEMSYGLGDLIRIRDLYGNKPKVRITSDTWTIDQQGAKRIPGFTPVKEGTNS